MTISDKRAAAMRAIHDALRAAYGSYPTRIHESLLATVDLIVERHGYGTESELVALTHLRALIEWAAYEAETAKQLAP